MIDHVTDRIQGVTLPETPWAFNYAKLEYARIGLVRVGSKNIWVKDLQQCWVCRKEFLATGYDIYCSESCTSQGEAREDNWRSE